MKVLNCFNFILEYDDPNTLEWCKESIDVEGRGGCMTDYDCLENARYRCDTDPNCFGVSWYPHVKSQLLKICRSREMEPKTDGWRTMMKSLNNEKCTKTLLYQFCNVFCPVSYWFRKLF